MSEYDSSTDRAGNFPGLTASVRIATFVNAERAAGTATLLRDIPDVTLVEVESLWGLGQRVRRKSISAVILDPEMEGRWPVEAATQIVAVIERATPVIFICRNASDAIVINKRVGGSNVVVLLEEGLTPERLRAILLEAITAAGALTDHTK